MTSATRAVAALSALAALLLATGCTAAPGSTAPTSSPRSTPNEQVGGDGTDDSDDLEGAILDDGRMFAVVTWGSSSCVPAVEEVAAEGQKVRVTLMDAATDQVCTADFAPRASIGALPEGVDPTQDVTLEVAYGDISDDVDLDGDAANSGAPGSSTEYLPSAGWVDDGLLVLLTWGSSGCPPIVESVEGSGDAGTATFATDDDRMCTMDMAPRATLLSFDDEAVSDDAFTLTLVGGGLDGTVTVRG
ncbi:hypothetical protein [Microbacterium sp. XT11]|uniref:hypothetical protein n=1 Tax=Microbacterium sp. XT11 TaxID=367477 RepID=UPI000742FF6E|nr:hypothetical protein [Microbacterium sp. XT11]ALX66309.1 hypothetical protein AB663_001378 [Microbacterium sp. XT11]